MSDESCEDCVYAKYGTNDPRDGYLDCRRHAPSVFDGVGTQWPTVHVTDWCGDFLAVRIVDEPLDKSPVIIERACSLEKPHNVFCKCDGRGVLPMAVGTLSAGVKRCDCSTCTKPSSAQEVAR